MANITKVEISTRSLERSSNGRPTSSRAWNDYSKESRVYVWPEAETFMENLEGRRNRPHNEWRPVVMKELKDAGYEVERLQWSQKAGCTCPCSPGFIVHLKCGDAIRDDKGKPVDIHISVK